MSELGSILNLKIMDTNNLRKNINKSIDNISQYVNSSFAPTRQSRRSYSDVEQQILSSINSCFIYWHEPWITSFLENKRECLIIYDLMEGLLHYESQIKNNEDKLPEDRAKAIYQAVARLVDYGTAILNIDIIIRKPDDNSSELDPSRYTTVEVFQAHTRAENLRKKLLYDYFEKDNRRDSIDDTNTSATSNNTLQVPGAQTIRSDKSTKGQLLGSNTSINTILSEGRRTPNAFQIEVKTQNRSVEIQPEVAQLIEEIRGGLTNGYNTHTRVINNALNKIESLLSVPTSSDKTLNCFELLDALLIAVERLPAETRHQEVAIISRSLLKPVIRKVYIGDHQDLIDYQQARWTTYLLSIMKLLITSDFNSHLRQFANLTELGIFIKEYIFVIKRFVSSNRSKMFTANNAMVLDTSDIDDMNARTPTYPGSWIEMILLADSTFLASLKCLFQTLRQYFASNQQIWSSFIDCLVQYLLQDALKLERPMFRQRQKLMADDLRKTAAEYVWISWDQMNFDHKQDLFIELIDPLLTACVVADSKQRRILLPIFYDMLRCDYISQYITSKDNRTSSQILTNFQLIDCPITDDQQPEIIFDDSTSQLDLDDISESFPYLSFRDNSSDGTVITKFTHLMIAKLNALMVDLSQGDESFKKELCDAISGCLDPKYYGENTFCSSSHNKQFRVMARHTADLLSEFMQICLDLREANKHSYNHLYLLCLFKLILFFKDKVDSIELYLNYLYKLYWLHHIAGRYVEAGFTLLEHAKSLTQAIEVHSRIVFRYFKSSETIRDHLSLKLFLYNLIVGYFDQGELWEAAVPLCREMIDIYQFETYEYNKLAQILQKLSTFFQNICSCNRRCLPEYFRVTFHGKGFPECIRDITVVYRGKPYEKLSDFQNTLLNKYPGSKLCSTMYKPEDNILDEHDAKYLQINACTPVVSLKPRFKAELKKIDESILNYYRYNECDKFSFSRRTNRPIPGDTSVNEFADMWREKFTLSTNTLPGILPFFPVYLIESTLVSPIESAIEDLERTNERLSCMVNRFKADKRHEEDIRLLGQLLLGIVDAAVNGGIARYEQAFFANSPPLRSRSQSTSRHQRQSYSSTTPDSPGLIDLKNESIVDPLSSGRQQPLPPTSDRHNQINIAGGYMQLSNALGGATNMRGVEKVIDPCMDRPTTHSDLLANHCGSATTANNSNVSGFDATQRMTNEAQVAKLKSLIARQVPLLDEAILLHRDRVADVMRPQHEYLEASYKKLKHHIMSNYSRYLPSDYNRSSTMRSLRSLARSPNRSARLDQSFSSRQSTISKRLSDAGLQLERKENLDTNTDIPYKQFNRSGRGSLPYSTMTITPGDRHLSARSTSSRADEESVRNIADLVNNQHHQLSSNASFVDAGSAVDCPDVQKQPIAAVRKSTHRCEVQSAPQNQIYMSNMESDCQMTTANYHQSPKVPLGEATTYSSGLIDNNRQDRNHELINKSTGLLQTNNCQNIRLSENVELL